MCKGLMIYFQLSTTFRYKSLKNSKLLAETSLISFQIMKRNFSNYIFFVSLFETKRV